MDNKTHIEYAEIKAYEQRGHTQKRIYLKNSDFKKDEKVAIMRVADLKKLQSTQEHECECVQQNVEETDEYTLIHQKYNNLYSRFNLVCSELEFYKNKCEEIGEINERDFKSIFEAVRNAYNSRNVWDRLTNKQPFILALSVNKCLKEEE